MLIAGMLRWWYIDGWLEQLAKVRLAFARVADRFSIGLLLKTLFAPFRQISADEQARGMNGLLNVIIDKLVSRMIGGFMRTMMIIIGSITLVLLAALSVVRLAVWGALPLMPIIGLIMMSSVGVPWKII